VCGLFTRGGAPERVPRAAIFLNPCGVLGLARRPAECRLGYNWLDSLNFSFPVSISHSTSCS
jgi:hypothetical protein